MTYNIEEISRGFQKAMQEAGDVSVDTDTDSQQRTRRQRVLDMWNEDIGRALAANEDLKLDDAHLAVIYSLRDHFLEHGFAKAGRVLGDMLDARFEDAGGRKYLRRLFPNGPVAQGMRIAGLPVPNLTENKGQGTAR
ncbi:tRNA 2-thiouridine synthesizing protein E [Thiogranum longum]|uniref:tRNA 2-thiouridine synthesizing protein E n=1 Tax=Thiogranum longum TaxID=1537524 RepID=A0A4R1HCA6_9GAMM|nr:TusE/DsrC/DsvC family sulfur relay protein [Thiogranum longum]TCK18251.1 tRNA 2-thiouridine synthesizing protein E [Thiogranum longum]